MQHGHGRKIEQVDELRAAVKLYAERANLSPAPAAYTRRAEHEEYAYAYAYAGRTVDETRVNLSVCACAVPTAPCGCWVGCTLSANISEYEQLYLLCSTLLMLNLHLFFNLHLLLPEPNRASAGLLQVLYSKVMHPARHTSAQTTIHLSYPFTHRDPPPIHPSIHPSTHPSSVHPSVHPS